MIEAVVKEIRVPAAPEVAFERFTKEVGSWWPRSTHSVSGDMCREVSWAGPVGASLYEVDEEGTEHVWGTFTAWDPPNRMAMTWHPGRDAETAQHIEITFEAQRGGTLVRLMHGNFEALGEKAEEIRGRYDGGWIHVLEMYAEALG